LKPWNTSPNEPLPINAPSFHLRLLIQSGFRFFVTAVDARTSVDAVIEAVTIEDGGAITVAAVAVDMGTLMKEGDEVGDDFESPE
jgi:hypothetical protein